MNFLVVNALNIKINIKVMRTNKNLKLRNAKIAAADKKFF